MSRLQLRAALTVLGKYGVSGAIACFLVYRLADSFDARLKAAEAQLQVVAEKLDAHAAAMERGEADRRATDRINRTLLRGICLGTSGDIPQARALCDIQDGQ